VFEHHGAISTAWQRWLPESHSVSIAWQRWKQQACLLANAGWLLGGIQVGILSHFPLHFGSLPLMVQ
jgi:hypothetical protein